MRNQKTTNQRRIATAINVIKTIAQFCAPWTLVGKIGAVLSVLSNKDKTK